MPNSSISFAELMQKAAAGEAEAIQQVFDSYGKHVIRAVRRRLGSKLRRRVDSEDISQSVWASFFNDTSRMSEFESPEALTAFLVTVSCNKVIDQTRKHVSGQSRSVLREREFSQTGGSSVTSAFVEKETPSQVATIHEERQRIADQYPSNYVRMLNLRREGHTQKEIAEIIGVNEKTVRRVLKKLFDQFDKQ